jgi:hypothetical protein
MTSAVPAIRPSANDALAAFLSPIIKLAVAGDTGPSPAAQRIFVSAAVPAQDEIESNGSDQYRQKNSDDAFGRHSDTAYIQHTSPAAQR